MLEIFITLTFLNIMCLEKKNKDSTKSTWEPRQRGNKIIGRMYAVSPAEVEKYHLRLLLLNVKGATSFIDLRTVKG